MGRVIHVIMPDSTNTLMSMATPAIRAASPENSRRPRDSIAARVTRRTIVARLIALVRPARISTPDTHGASLLATATAIGRPVWAGLARPRRPGCSSLP